MLRCIVNLRECLAPLLGLPLVLVGCTVSFSQVDPGTDSRPDVSVLSDVTVQFDGSVDVGVLADAGSDAAPPVPDGGCPPDSKECAATCVPLTDPQTGCAASGCDPCAFDHATSLCVGGACALGSCDGAWDSCDSDPVNGCETDLATDASNCGSCDHVCSLPQANVGCQSSGCQFLSCVGDYRDCDNDLQTNGCETDTTFDDLNCGACGVVCAPGFDCSATACRCSTDSDCNTGGGGTCDVALSLCRCPIAWCQGPCHTSGNGCQ